ncbi:hypothetical protein I7I51_08061 [Histoplasma capsulatum]|uniref:Uncharacterized protein n=1 Tax=Ajellomyces capsulatus TaxID=5037 RepID=A0A8A1M1J4_AJECA|nr:hypothetical protein I7I51_08061 [Histoplasma capsulatum]
MYFILILLKQSESVLDNIFERSNSRTRATTRHLTHAQQRLNELEAQIREDSSIVSRPSQDAAVEPQVARITMTKRRRDWRLRNTTKGSDKSSVKDTSITPITSVKK